MNLYLLLTAQLMAILGRQGWCSSRVLLKWWFRHRHSQNTPISGRRMGTASDEAMLTVLIGVGGRPGVLECCTANHNPATGFCRRPPRRSWR